MPDRSKSSRRTRMAAAACALAAGVAWWGTRPPGAPGSAPAPAPAGRATAAPADGRSRGPEAPPAEAPAAAALAEASYIARAEVEPAEACPGDPIRVTVVLRPSIPEAAELQVVIAGQPGNPAVLTFSEQGEHSFPIQVIRRAQERRIDSTRAAVRILPSCDPDRQRLALDVLPLPGRNSHSFLARLEGTGGARAVRYAWDLDDGTTTETEGPHLEHSYAARAQEAPSSTFLAAVEARLSDGRRLRAARTVTLENLYFLNKRRGRVVPEVSPVVATLAGGAFQATALVRHFEPSPLALGPGEIAFQPCAGEAPPARAVSARDVLGTTEIAPGASALAVRIAAADVPPGTCTTQLTFSGVTREGPPFTLFIPVVTDTGGGAGASVAPQAAAAVLPPDQQAALLARVRRAMELLGRAGDGARVTDEEIALLERQGRL